MRPHRTLQTVAQLAGTLVCTATLAACAGGSNAVPPPSKSLAASPPMHANATVRILWPTRTTPQDALRKALYISQDTDHIKVTNTNYYGALAPSDSIVTIPFGQAQATIPAFVGPNYWQFAEYYADESVGEVAIGYADLQINDPLTVNSVDVVLNLNLNAMGVHLASDTIFCYALPMTSITLNGSSAAINLVSPGVQTFNMYLQPTDRGSKPGSGRIATGPGTPGLSLTTIDPRLTLDRFTNPNSSGPYAGIAYHVQMNKPLSSTTDQMVLQANSLDSNNVPTAVGPIIIASNCPG